MTTQTSTTLRTALSVQHEVSNFDNWRKVYQKISTPGNRITILRALESPNKLLVFEATESHDNGRSYINSDKIKNAMEKAGVKGAPNFSFIDIKEFHPNNLDNKYAITVSHSVENFNTWRAYFDADNERREDSGLYLVAMGTAEGNPNKVTMCFTAKNVETAKDFANNPILEEVMKEAGVNSTPSFKYWSIES